MATQTSLHADDVTFTTPQHSAEQTLARMCKQTLAKLSKLDCIEPVEYLDRNLPAQAGTPSLCNNMRHDVNWDMVLQDWIAAYVHMNAHTYTYARRVHSSHPLESPVSKQRVQHQEVKH